jgi:hypothetical protein
MENLGDEDAADALCASPVEVKVGCAQLPNPEAECITILEQSSSLSKDERNLTSYSSRHTTPGSEFTKVTRQDRMILSTSEGTAS